MAGSFRESVTFASQNNEEKKKRKKNTSSGLRGAEGKDSEGIRSEDAVRGGGICEAVESE